VSKLRSEKSRVYTSAGKYAEWSGCLESPSSPAYRAWLASLPQFLLEIMTEELEAREAAARKNSPRINSNSSEG
jgi:hypothetical protein